MKKFIYDVVVFHEEDEIAELFINADNETELWHLYDTEYADEYPSDSVATICGCDLA